MNFEALKYIYTWTLLNHNKIQYLGNNKYRLISFYPNGTKHWEEEYRDGKQHGKYIGWWENGTKVWERDYREGVLVEP